MLHVETDYTGTEMDSHLFSSWCWQQHRYSGSGSECCNSLLVLFERDDSLQSVVNLDLLFFLTDFLTLNTLMLKPSWWPPPNNSRGKSSTIFFL